MSMELDDGPREREERDVLSGPTGCRKVFVSCLGGSFAHDPFQVVDWRCWQWFCLSLSLWCNMADVLVALRHCC